MAAGKYLLSSFLSLTTAFALFFTWLHLPSPPPNAANLLNLDRQIPTRLRDHASDTPHHPLDPLTVQEINKLRSILSSHPLFKSSPFSIHSLVLEEPEKSVVLKWQNGDVLPPRKASVIVRVNGNTHVLTVDLTSANVVILRTGPHSGYPTMTVEEMNTATWVPLQSEIFNQTILDRGISLSDLACLPLATGWFGPAEENRRVIKVQCFSTKDTANFYMRPIEGLTVLVDLDAQRVIEISDKGKNIPIPKAANTDYRYSAQPPNKVIKMLNPISIEQPKGPSFTVEDDYLVKWANWEFHLKPDPRAGTVISRVKVKDPETGIWRDVIYKGFPSELFVPYMDPSDAWYFKTYMDAGEYGFGLQAMSLDPLNDCPRNAHYMDGVFAAVDGKPYVRRNMICLFESYAGDIGWRHAETPITGLDVSALRKIKRF